MKLLRTFPDLNSKAILNITRSLITQIDDELYDNLVRHTFDPMVFEVMCNSSELDE